MKTAELAVYDELDSFFDDLAEDKKRIMLMLSWQSQVDRPDGLQDLEIAEPRRTTFRPVVKIQQKKNRNGRSPRATF